MRLGKRVGRACVTHGGQLCLCIFAKKSPVGNDSSLSWEIKLFDWNDLGENRTNEESLFAM